MATLSRQSSASFDTNSEDNDTGDTKQQQQTTNQNQQQLQQLQRDLADAISRLAPLDDIRILLASGAKPNLPVTQGLHPIHYAVYQNFLAAARLLILRGCDINVMDDNGYTPIHLCAERGYYDLLKFLIENKAIVSFSELRKQSSSAVIADEPLSLALRKDHLDCAQLLLDNGADPNASYFMGSEINRVNIIKVNTIKLLLKYGADPDARDRSGLTPLMRAARNPLGYATVKVLIEHKADVNNIAGEKHDYRTVLHHSIFSGNIDIIRLLLSSGARYPRLKFDKPSPLDIAIISGSPEIVKLLVDYDADVNHGAKSIGLPLSMALTQNIKNKYEIVRILLDGGADPNAIIIRTTRQSGPPLSDYMHSIHQFAATRRFHSIHAIGFDRNEVLSIVRMLLSFGARVSLVKSMGATFLSLVRTLDRLHDELSIKVLHLLIDATEELEIEPVMKIIDNCITHLYTLPSRVELDDPSNKRVVNLQTIKEHRNFIDKQKDLILYDDILERLSKYTQKSTQGFAVISLKQLARIHIRRHLTASNSFQGRKLIRSLNNLPIPLSLRNYITYQDESDFLTLNSQYYQHKTQLQS